MSRSGKRDPLEGPVLTFPGGRKRDPAVELWLNQRAGPLGAIARDWFEVMRSAGDDVEELIHDGCPVVCVKDAAFAYVNVFTSHVNVGFFLGAALEDPGQLLVGEGKRMRHVKLKPGDPVDAAALQRLIGTAYRDIKSRLDRG